MFVLRIEHPVPDFNAWKRAFDSDPVGRKRSGVRRFRILRSADDRGFVTVDLELDSQAEATALHSALQVLWGRVEGQIIHRPQARILELIESAEY